MHEIASTRIRYGFWRIFVLLRREGWQVNHKRVCRLYKEEGLNLRSKRPRRRKAAAHRLERPVLTAANQSWSMDFVSDALFDGQRFRALTLMDNFTRECLAIEPGQSLTEADVVRILTHVSERRQASPRRIQADNVLNASAWFTKGQQPSYVGTNSTLTKKNKYYFPAGSACTGQISSP